MRYFQDIIFIWTQIYGEISKSALVCTFKVYFIHYLFKAKIHPTAVSKHTFMLFFCFISTAEKLFNFSWCVMCCKHANDFLHVLAIKFSYNCLEFNLLCRLTIFLSFCTTADMIWIDESLRDFFGVEVLWRRKLHICSINNVCVCVWINC